MGSWSPSIALLALGCALVGTGRTCREADVGPSRGVSLRCRLPIDSGLIYDLQEVPSVHGREAGDA